LKLQEGIELIENGFGYIHRNYGKAKMVGLNDVCLLSKGDFESKDGSCFRLVKISTLPSNPIFNPFSHEFRVANTISKNATEFFIVFAGIFQDSEAKQSIN